MGGGTIRTYTVILTTTGSAGSATDSEVTEHIQGWFLDAYLDYHASAPATTDVTIKQTGHADSILAVADNATDGRYAPRQALVSRAAAAITNSHDLIPVNGTLTVSAAQSDALTAAVTVTIRVLTF